MAGLDVSFGVVVITALVVGVIAAVVVLVASWRLLRGQLEETESH